MYQKRRNSQRGQILVEQRVYRHLQLQAQDIGHLQALSQMGGNLNSNNNTLYETESVTFAQFASFRILARALRGGRNCLKPLLDARRSLYAMESWAKPSHMQCRPGRFRTPCNARYSSI